jgi:hypothetical protein
MPSESTLPWWERPVTIRRGDIVIGVVTWTVLDLISITVRHFL